MKPLFVHPDKIDKYLLDLEHAEGGPKAKFFVARGFKGDTANRLPRALMAHFETARLVLEQTSKQNKKLVFECNMPCPDGTSPCIVSVWVDDPREPFTRFVTAYPAA